MKYIISIESLGLMLLTCVGYHLFFPSSWWFFAMLFFVPDISFVAYAISNKVGAFLYNLLHHQGVIALMIIVGWILKTPSLEQIGIIFLAHSFFDRVLGYGLKYSDSFHHTHLGWIGKQANKNQQ